MLCTPNRLLLLRKEHTSVCGIQVHSNGPSLECKNIRITDDIAIISPIIVNRSQPNIPSLANVIISAAYWHNGIAGILSESSIMLVNYVIHFQGRQLFSELLQFSRYVSILMTMPFRPPVCTFQITGIFIGFLIM